MIAWLIVISLIAGAIAVGLCAYKCIQRRRRNRWLVNSRINREIIHSAFVDDDEDESEVLETGCSITVGDINDDGLDVSEMDANNELEINHILPALPLLTDDTWRLIKQNLVIRGRLESPVSVSFAIVASFISTPDDMGSCLTKPILMSICRDYGLTGYSKLHKNELIDLIFEYTETVH